MKPVAPADLTSAAGTRSPLIARLLPKLAMVRDALSRRRRSMLTLATILFVGGLAWAFRSAGIAIADLAWRWLLAAGALGMVGVILNGVELSWCARALGKRVPAGEAIQLSSMGILSNLLPIPGSVLVRGGALVARGAGMAESGRVLLFVGLLRLAVAGAITGIALLPLTLGIPVIAGSLVATMVLFALIARIGGVANALMLLALRMGMLATVAVQLLLCFRALGVDAVLRDSALQAIAPVVGSAVGIVPGGLGVSEAIGAALAVLISASPALAFAALALNRMAGYACAFLTVLGFQARDLAARRSR
ncbi:MAG: hypothetical protein GW855_03960 [Erythrobacter sp.]|nr:hypothetical protein [Erythrobacter sp.]NCQ64529.1 hypothetical protein [Alphaproteobacteria bacterium]